MIVPIGHWARSQTVGSNALEVFAFHPQKNHNKILKMEEKTNEMEKNSPLENLKLFDKIIEMRKFEIENFWKRTLFFWGIIAIIYAGYFKADISDEFKIIIPLLGLLFNIIFSLSTRGSKYWQEHWEMMAFDYEKEHDFQLFLKDQQYQIAENNKSCFTRPYRFSVSKLTMLLGDLSVIIWLILWVKELYFLIHFKFLRFEICDQPNIINWYTIGIISVHAILIGYFILFLTFGSVYHKFEEE